MGDLLSIAWNGGRSLWARVEGASSVSSGEAPLSSCAKQGRCLHRSYPPRTHRPEETPELYQAKQTTEHAVKTVTHLPGLKRYLCPRLHSARGTENSAKRQEVLVVRVRQAAFVSSRRRLKAVSLRARWAPGVLPVEVGGGRGPGASFAFAGGGLAGGRLGVGIPSVLAIRRTVRRVI